MGAMSDGFTGTIIKDRRTTTRGGWKWGREAGKGEVVEKGKGERQKTVLEQQ